MPALWGSDESFLSGSQKVAISLHLHMQGAGAEIARSLEFLL